MTMVTSLFLNCHQVSVWQKKHCCSILWCVTNKLQNAPKYTSSHFWWFVYFNPLEDRGVNWLHFAIQVLPTF